MHHCPLVDRPRLAAAWRGWQCPLRPGPKEPVAPPGLGHGAGVHAQRGVSRARLSGKDGSALLCPHVVTDPHVRCLQNRPACRWEGRICGDPPPRRPHAGAQPCPQQRGTVTETTVRSISPHVE